MELRAPHRYCLLVVKDGEIVHESYFANTSETVYESDSLGKTATAALFGVARRPPRDPPSLPSILPTTRDGRW